MTRATTAIGIRVPWAVRCISGSRRTETNDLVFSFHLTGICKQQLTEAVDQLQRYSYRLDANTYVHLLRVCSKTKALSEGKLIHYHIKSHDLGHDVFLCNNLVNMYSKCGSVEDAREVFDKMSSRNIVSWTALVSGYVQCGNANEALLLFHQMLSEGVQPDHFMFSTILDACATPKALGEGKLIHAHILRSKFDSDMVIGNALINMYAKCGSVDDAQRSFNMMQKPNVVSWSSLIAAYTEHGLGKKGLEAFWKMETQGASPNKVTFLNVLHGCAMLTHASGKLIHGCVIAKRLHSDTVIGNALINMYGKFKCLEDAQVIFEKMCERTAVSWTSMINVYSQNEHLKEALQLFSMMFHEGMRPDKVTFIAVLDVCASMSALAEGTLAHSCIVGKGLASDTVLGNALLNMYAKCGSIFNAHSVFQEMSKKDEVSWSAMIAAYACYGSGEEAVQLFNDMQRNGMKPNEISLLGILSTYSRRGLIDEGYHCFVSMFQDYLVAPLAEHYRCMLSLLGRAGQIDQVEDFYNKIPIEPDLLTWTSLLGMCKVPRGKCTIDHMFEFDYGQMGKSSYDLIGVL